MEYVFIDENTDLSSLKNRQPFYYFCINCKTKVERKPFKFDGVFLCKSCKTKQTCLNKYGVDNVAKSIQAKEKYEQTCLEKYGVKCALERQDIKEKARQTKLEKYGDENYNNTAKQKQTCLDRYGVDSYTKTDEYKEKSKRTNNEKYGVDNYTQTEEYKERVKQTNTKKYGVEYYVMSKEFKTKSKRTCRERYGVDNIAKLDLTIQKIKQTNLEKYGVDHLAKTLDFHKNKKHKYEYDNISFDSTWEIIAYKYFKNQGKQVEKFQGFFEYEYDGQTCRYFPDLIVDGQILEIKGPQFFNENGELQNPFNHLLDEKCKAKQKCMLENNVQVLLYEDIKKMKEYLEN